MACEAYRLKRFNATKKDIEFHLTESEYLNIVTGDCHYCGKQSNFGLTVAHNDRASIDRKDNDIRAYTVDNCVPACVRCNVRKGIATYEDFMALIDFHGSVEEIPESYVGVKEVNRRFYYKNREKNVAYSRNYRSVNKEVVNAKDRERHQIRKQDPEFVKACRDRINALRGTLEYRARRKAEWDLKMQDPVFREKERVRSSEKHRRKKEREQCEH